MHEANEVFEFLMLLDLEALRGCRDGMWHGADKKSADMIDQAIAIRLSEKMEMASERV